jgi:anti-sigma B factor antagonist
VDELRGSAGGDRVGPEVDGERVGAVIETEEHGDSCYVVRVDGYLDLGSKAALEHELLPLTWLPRARVTLDLSDAEAIESSALGVIRRAVVELWSNGGELAVVSPAGSVRRSLRITGLDRLIRVHDGTESAAQGRG